MEIKFRYELNKLLPENPVVAELGNAEGRFSETILKWGVSKLFMVDTWRKLNQTGDGNFDESWHQNNYKEAMERVEPFKEKVTVLRGLSFDMAVHVEDNSLDLLYIDACHEYESVMKDLKAWYPKVKTGGIISCHDFLAKQYGVNRAVKDFVSQMFIPLKDIHVTEENGDKSMVSCWFIKK